MNNDSIKNEMKKEKDDRLIEDAISFLVISINKTGNNPKPVILHSIRVGIHLYNLNYDKNIVISGLLHDIIEDSSVTPNEIKSKYGNEIFKLINANTFNKSITDETLRYKDNFNRCLNAGKQALIVKAADLFDNVDYYHLASSNELTIWLFNKLDYFINLSKDILTDEIIFQKLVKKYNYYR